MKVIFLDFDGVLNNHKSLARGIHLDPENVLLLNGLCQDTDADIVVSSIWRFHYSRREMEALLRCAGSHHGEVIDMTGRSDDGFRGKEIKAWLDKYKIEAYVILDDSSDMLDEQKQYFVHIDGSIGLSQKDVDKAIKVLGRKSL